jgi:mono/diheme cytochrome c family protein
MNACLLKKIFIIIAFSSAFLLACTDSRSAKAVWRAPDAAVQTENPITYSVESVTRGKVLFEQHCQKCHGYWGEGNGVVGLSLNKRPANLLHLAGKKAEGEFAWKISEGRGDMPGFRKILSEEDIWHIVNFVQSLENEEGSGDPLAQGK